MYTLINCIIYTGYERLDNHAVIIEKEQIKQVCPIAELPQDIEIHDLQNAILAPGFIKLVA